MTKLKSRLPKSKTDELAAFIAGADDKTAETSEKNYPWQMQGVREDVIKVYNLRLSEPYLLKLKYISEQTPDSMHKFCLTVLQAAIDAKIAELSK